jgi:dTDP-4-dehydrorhamnose 3,5-epimerase-like enzyme
MNDTSQGPIIKLEDPIVDERGFIQRLVSFPTPIVGSVVLIFSKKGTIRANHYHKTDWHYCFVIEGIIEYYFRNANSTAEPEKVIVKKGEMVYTPPMVEHAMVFLDDTTFLAISGGTRLQADYEADLVRVQLVTMKG